jgi:MGT family glycosyltransferase
VRAGRDRRYALFVAIPAFGHARPLLLQAEELARRGWRTALASTSELCDLLARSGADTRFLDLGAAPGRLGDLAEIGARASDQPSFVRSTMAITAHLTRLWPTMFDGLVSAIARDRPDVMVVDFVSAAGFDAADQAGVPFVVNNADLLSVISLALLPAVAEVPQLFSGDSPGRVRARNRLLRPVMAVLATRAVALTIGRQLNALRRTRGLAPVDVNMRLAGRMIMVDSAFGLEYARPLPPLIQMVGPMIDPRPAPPSADLRGWLEGGRPVAVVSLGTIARPGRGLVERLAAGLVSDDFRALWVMTDSARSELVGALAPGVRVEPWLPSLLGVLTEPAVRAFVSHCGVNSVHEAVWAGRPIVGIPLFADQRDMAARVRDAGAGLWLDKVTFTPDQLRAAVRRACAEPGLRRTMPALRSSFELAGGVRRAADLIEQAASVGVDHYRVGWSAGS